MGLFSNFGSQARALPLQVYGIVTYVSGQVQSPGGVAEDFLDCYYFAHVKGPDGELKQVVLFQEEEPEGGIKIGDTLIGTMRKLPTDLCESFGTDFALNGMNLTVIRPQGGTHLGLVRPRVNRASEARLSSGQ